MNFIRKNVTAGAVCTVTIVLALASSTPASSTGAPFKHPGAIALDHDGHLWVANQDYFGITEIEASTGKFIRRIDARADGFLDPSGIAVSGNDVWVVSGSVTYQNGKSKYGRVTEIDATTGVVVRVINLKKHGFTGLSGVSADARHVWVTADGGEQVAELSSVTGKVLHAFHWRNSLVESSSIATYGGLVWIPNPEGPVGLVERSDATGKRIRTITPTAMVAPPDGGNKNRINMQPRFVAVDARFVWTGNDQGLSFKLGGGSVTQINAATGKVVRTVDTAADRFHANIQSIVSDGTHVWIVNGSVYTRGGRRGDSITELNALNGSLIRVVQLHDGIYSDPVGLVSNGVDVWVTDSAGGAIGIGSVIEFNAATSAVVRVIGHCCSGQ